METPDPHASSIGDIGHEYDDDDDGEKTRLRRVGWTAWKYWELGRATGFVIPQSFLLISNSSETGNAVGRRFRDALAAPRCVIDLSSDMSAAPVSSLLSPFTRILIGDLPLSFGGALLD
jgi:hypothetical protein